MDEIEFEALPRLKFTFGQISLYIGTLTLGELFTEFTLGDVTLTHGQSILFSAATVNAVLGSINAEREQSIELKGFSICYLLSNFDLDQ